MPQSSWALISTFIRSAKGAVWIHRAGFLLPTESHLREPCSSGRTDSWHGGRRLMIAPRQSRSRTPWHACCADLASESGIQYLHCLVCPVVSALSASALDAGFPVVGC